MERSLSLFDMTTLGFVALLGNVTGAPRATEEEANNLVGLALAAPLTLSACGFSKLLFGVPPVAHNVRTLAGDLRMQFGQYQFPSGIAVNRGTRHLSYSSTIRQIEFCVSDEGPWRLAVKKDK
jgi:hypothetical protein